jgi:hypothetical protein
MDNSTPWPLNTNSHRCFARRSGPRQQLLAQLYPRFIPSDPALLKAFGYGPQSVPGLLEVNRPGSNGDSIS